MKILLLIFSCFASIVYSQEQSYIFDNLIVPSDLSEPALFAIQYYPELKNVSIEVVYANTKTTMETRPIVSSLFSKQRRYRIFVDTFVENDFGLLVSEIPLQAKIGLLGHEFAHILDYESKSIFEILKIGKTYMTKGNIRHYETFIDQLTIEHGLGSYLKIWSDYVLNKSNASDKYKHYKMKNYLTPAEIQRSIDYISRPNR